MVGWSHWTHGSSEDGFESKKSHPGFSWFAEGELASAFREKRVGERNLVEAHLQMYEAHFLSSTGVPSCYSLSHRSSLFGFFQICVTSQRAFEGCHNKATITGL